MLDTAKLANEAAKRCGAREAIARIRGNEIDVMFAFDDFDHPVMLTVRSDTKLDEHTGLFVMAELERGIANWRNTLETK